MATERTHPGLYDHEILNQVTLPSGTTYDLNDKTSLHFLGTSLTDVTVNSGVISGDQVNVGTDATTNADMVTVSKNDVVIYGTAKLLYLCADVTHTSGSKSSTWVCISPNTAANAITGVTIGSTTVDTATVADNIANFESISAANIAAGALASGMTAATPTADAEIATKKYIDDAVAPLANPMIFKGTATILADGSISVGDSTIKQGYTYKIATITTEYSGNLKEGDTLIAKKDNPKTEDWTENTDWAVVPSGDEPSGTVLEVNTGIGLTGGPINTTGTIKVDLRSETALNATATVGTASDRLFAVVLDTQTTGEGQEAVTTNKLAVAVPAGTLATTVSDASAGTAVTGVTAPEAGTASVTGNIVYCDVAAGSTTLTFNYIKVATANDVVFNHAPQNNG